jgi:hypothetical protein
MSALLSWFWVDATPEDTGEMLRIKLLMLPTNNTNLDPHALVATIQDAIDYVVGITEDTLCTATVNEVEADHAKLHLFLTHDPSSPIKIKQKCSLFVTYLASSLTLQLDMKVMVAYLDEVTFKSNEKATMVTDTNPNHVLTYSK